MENNKKPAAQVRLTDPQLSRRIGNELFNGVVTAAVMSEKRRPGLWQDMLRAADRGAARTKEGTIDAFFFQAMVDRLLEEFHAIEKET